VPVPIREGVAALIETLDRYGDKYPELRGKLIQAFKDTYSQEEIDQLRTEVEFIKRLMELSSDG